MSNLKNILTAEFERRCIELELSPKTVAVHVARVQDALIDKKDLTIAIRDTCRFDNGGLLAEQVDIERLPQPHGIVSFIPAAGASSRYYKPFADLLLALESGSRADVEKQIAGLKTIGADTWPLPAAVKTLFHGTSPDYRAAAAALNLPKGLLPCVAEGDTFFDLKVIEDERLPFVEGTTFVVAPEHRYKFEAALPSRSKQRVHFAEQGPALSTIRINEDGTPHLEEDGSFSKVPAGHGMLSSLIPNVSGNHPSAHSVLIRNIDNVMGTSTAALSSAAAAARKHCLILEAVAAIRLSLKSQKLEQAKTAARDLAEILDLRLEGEVLWDLQKKLFSSDRTTLQALEQQYNSEGEALQALYDRPVNTLGMVPNTNHDVGGTPVFATIADAPAKICLEVPHASPSDKENFLANPEKATHFNPVFAFAEVGFAQDYYQKAPVSCWLLAKKTYKGNPVYYHETVLYELIGNSLLANVSFTEIPRVLFNPHKQPADAAERQLKDWVKSPHGDRQ